MLVGPRATAQRTHALRRNCLKVTLYPHTAPIHNITIVYHTPSSWCFALCLSIKAYVYKLPVLLRAPRLTHGFFVGVVLLMFLVFYGVLFPSIVLVLNCDPNVARVFGLFIQFL